MVHISADAFEGPKGKESGDILCLEAVNFQQCSVMIIGNDVTCQKEKRLQIFFSSFRYVVEQSMVCNDGLLRMVSFEVFKQNAQSTRIHDALQALSRSRKK